MRVISFYTTEDGKTPVADFLNTLSSQQARKVTWVLKLVQEQEKVPSSYFKKLVSTEEIWKRRHRQKPSGWQKSVAWII
ncbi:hypothetical protein [Endozoicomonas sp. 8E]|uniref:hypothetical protein n=1 Tax=Endozoicomonas sp. 8E TaxID=3035692 RepID=UPI0029391644|nr:hypothetical protein [Endozoicomonas sp. 8E]WOG26507.1 hypothetical protein P6910_18435 [Endozoicomonas sp. 8E]